jgi:phage shock protein PspC (stress-responsive transcriptional regulator)
MAELEPAPAPRRLYRSRNDKKVAGVLGGFAEFFGLDPSFIRILYVIATALTAFVPLTFLYIVMAFVIPQAPKPKSATG